MLQLSSISSSALRGTRKVWWNEEALAKQIGLNQLSQVRCWLSVGNQETQDNAIHSPTNMVQSVSQVDSCRQLVEAMSNSGATVKVHVFDGGHDPACWASELPQALYWLSKSS